MHSAFHLLLRRFLPERIDVEMRNQDSRQRRSNRIQSVVFDIVAVAEKHYVRPEILRGFQEFAVCNDLAERTDVERGQQPGHVAVGKFAQPPSIAHGSACEFSAGTHAEIAVAADHQIVNEQNARQELHLLFSPIVFRLLPWTGASRRSRVRQRNIPPVHPNRRDIPLWL